jgi:hypothetical protein
VADCPDGYTESENLCVSTQLCHSTCATCSVKNDQTKCSTCSSTLTSLVYNTLIPPGSCSLPATNNAQLLMTINQNTVLGTSSLKNITYNSGTQSTSGTVLSSLPQLYTLNVIDFLTLTSNTVTFEFGLTEKHEKLLVRARVMTECNAVNSQNTTLQMTFSGPSNTVVTQSLSPNAETIVEGQVVHSTSAFILKIQFGTQGQNCRKILQDVSIFYENCQAYCASNDCPNTQPYFKHPTESRCVADCPDGYTESENYCLSITKILNLP